MGSDILVVTSFAPSSGGYTAYARTFVEYCHEHGVKCTWLFPGKMRFVGRAFAVVRSRSIFAPNEVKPRAEQLQRSSVRWLGEIILWFILLQIHKKPRYTRVVCMDVLSSIALRPDLLIVHGPYANEVRRRFAWKGLAYAVSRKLESIGYRRAQRLVSVDEYLQNRIRVLAGLDSILIPNPISLDQFTIRDKAEAKTALEFEPYKPLVVFIGFTPEKYAEMIPGWREQLEPLGFATAHAHDIPYDEMPVYYNAADIVVSLSTVPAYQRAVIESLACGTPVLSNNSQLAYYASPDNLIEAIKRFRCGESREQLRNRVVKFDRNLICEEILSLLQCKCEPDRVNH